MSGIRLVLFLFLLVHPLAAQPVERIATRLFNIAYEGANLGEDAVSMAAEAVWGASELNGEATFTGTLTQTDANADTWRYESNPTDRLAVTFADATTFTFLFHTFDGYVDGTWQDFVEQHDLNFDVTLAGVLDLQIQSGSRFAGKASSKAAAPEGKTTLEWSRRQVGTVLFDGESMALDLTSAGKFIYEIDGFSGWAELERQEQCTGTASTTSTAYTIDQSRWAYLLHYSETATHLRNSQVWNNSSVNTGGVTYQFQNAHAAWAAGSHLYGEDFRAPIYNAVIDPNYWDVQGELLANGNLLGVLDFSKQPVHNDTPLPELMLRMTGGGAFVLHSTLTGATATATAPALEPPTAFVLAQNYPNPFNPATTIRFSLPEASEVSLKVYNTLGEEVMTLVDEFRAAGMYDAAFDARGLSAGIYLYQIKAQGFSATRKMVLLK